VCLNSTTKVIDYYLSHSPLFSRALEKTHKYPWSGLCNPNQIVSISEKKKSEPLQYVSFCVFFYVKGLCWPLYNPRISWKAIAVVIWTVNNDHDTTNTPKKLNFFEKNVWKEVKWRMKQFVQDASLFIA